MVSPLPDNFLEELQDLEMEHDKNVNSNCIKRLLEMYLMGISYYDAKQRSKKREYYYGKLLKLKDDPRTQEVLEQDYENNERKKLESELVTPEEKTKIKEKILNRTTLNSKNKLSYISQLVKTVQHAAKKRDYLVKGQLNEMEILLGKRMLERKKQKKNMKKQEADIRVIPPKKKNKRKNKLFDRLKKNKKQKNKKNSEKSLKELHPKPPDISKMEETLQLKQEQLEIELVEEEERLQAELKKQLAFEQEQLAIELALEEKELQQEIENQKRLKAEQFNSCDEKDETVPLKMKRKKKKKLGKLFNKLKNKKIKRKKQEQQKQQQSSPKSDDLAN